ncbi:GH1 family beta-glucosidase [Amycolatopsis aidingensis]|uniref:GH1 family beta-glucosidase n=1 Tax=Amycolatopsis aidingensis TaxID=2842453 RepID=UPI001C0BB88A|nr:GH1 family beta-glucosidase [Amycolatopsis aidingensis]
MSVLRDEASQRAEIVPFPNNFVWGVATAAFQVEGSTTVDGRSASIWDVFCRQPGAVVGGDTGDPAADHYRRMAEDVALMADLGIRAYRFSIAWPRVRPDGGAVNPAGLDFYQRLVDELLAHDIAPWPTLYHWDLPQALEDRGGWANRETVYRFAEYTESVLGVLGDRVANWTTFNEPWCSSFLGYAAGKHAPGRTDPHAAVAAGHHLLLAHGHGLEVIREHAPTAQAGITLNLFPVQAADPRDPVDVEAARRIDGLQNRFFLEPLLRGAYPDDLLADLAPYQLAAHLRDGDLERIAAPLDLLGVNYYRDHHVSGHRDGESGPPSPWVGAEHVSFPRRNLPRTDSDWEVNPDGLTTLLLDLHQRYPGLPFYVTENGAAYPDVLTEDGVEDLDRAEFLTAHLRAARVALDQGVDLRGYFYWSLLDNFEWAEGYAKRFGLVHVDYATQRRTPKLSAFQYAQVIADNGVRVS